MGGNVNHAKNQSSQSFLRSSAWDWRVYSCFFLTFFFLSGNGFAQNDSLRFKIDSLKPNVLSPDSIKRVNKKGGQIALDTLNQNQLPEGNAKKGGGITDTIPKIAINDTLPPRKRLHIPTLYEVREIENEILLYSEKQIPVFITEIFRPMDSTGQKPSVAYKRALLIPGWGQVYNRSYWKIPVIYAGLGGVGYFAYYNHKQYKNYQQGYLYATDDDSNTDPATIDSEFATFPAEGLRTRRDQYRTTRDQLVLVLAGVYALQAVEAYVQAHLKHFEVSDDLSFQVYPYVSPAEAKWAGEYKPRTTSGIGIKMRF